MWLAHLLSSSRRLYCACRFRLDIAATVINTDANLNTCSSSILSEWGNFSEDDITGRLARRCLEQRHRAKRRFILSPFSSLISHATIVAIAKRGVGCACWFLAHRRRTADKMAFQKSDWCLWRWYLPQRETMQTNGRVSCEGTSEASRSTHLSSSSFWFVSHWQRKRQLKFKQGRCSDTDGAKSCFFFCKVFELSLRLYFPSSLTHTKTSWRTKSRFLTMSNFSSHHAEKTVCVPPLSLHSPPGCHVLSWIGEMWNITHNQKSAIYHANRAWGRTAVWGKTDSQEGDRLEVKPLLESLKLFFFFNSPKGWRPWSMLFYRRWQEQKHASF